MLMVMSRCAGISLAVGLAVAGGARAADPVEVSIVIKDHRFEPASITIPAGVRVKFVVRNEDPTPEEIESHDLGFEKVIPGGTQGVVRIAPMEAGNYTFFGEFNPDTARGTVIVE